MKIYKISPKGDELLLDTTDKKEALKVLEKYAKEGCSFAANLDTVEVESELVREIEDIFRPGVKTVHILYPMAGGNG